MHKYPKISIHNLCRTNILWMSSLRINQWIDSFNNKHIQCISKIDNSTQQQLHTRIQKYIPQFSHGMTNAHKYPAVWIHLYKNNLHILGSLLSNQKYNFKIHHAFDQRITLYQWLATSSNSANTDIQTPDMITPYSMFYISCGALLVNNKQQMLVVQQKIGPRINKYGIPGGRADFGQSISKCVTRQLYEQTNIKAQYKYLVYLRETNYTHDGSIDLYFVCYVKCEQQQLQALKLCEKQLKDYKWIPIGQAGQFLKQHGVETQSHLGKYIAQLHKSGFNFQRNDDQFCNKTVTRHYVSQKDQVARQFIEHMLI